MGTDWNDTQLGRWFTRLYNRNKRTIAMLGAVLSVVAAVVTIVIRLF